MATIAANRDEGTSEWRDETPVIIPAPHPLTRTTAGAYRHDLDQPDVDTEHAETWALVLAAQAGDPDAFGQLYDRYVDTVFKFIYYRVGDRTVAEDLTSDTFLRALRSIASISYQGRDIGAWLITIARNITLDHSTSARARWEVGTAELVENGLSLDSAEVTVLSRLTNERLRQAINELKDDQRECIVLRFMKGLSVAETARMMGRNEGSVKALQHRAVKRLASVVADELK
jgi:RNA polymerase sigma-70 factor (ECF subfamily)